MKLDSVDLYDEDIRSYNTADTFSNALSTEDVLLSKDVPIVIKYDYIDLNDTEYNFFQKFTERDTQEYFRMMKKISSNTINSLAEEAREYHFHRSDVRGRLKEALKKAIPKAINSNPIIYHFGLYECESHNANRETGERSPRIYFALGANGFVYVLFFDPYHELNPMA